MNAQQIFNLDGAADRFQAIEKWPDQLHGRAVSDPGPRDCAYGLYLSPTLVVTTRSVVELLIQ
jgi:hypothetical protein